LASHVATAPWSSASVTSCAVLLELIDQPTMRREYKSNYHRDKQTTLRPSIVRKVRDPVLVRLRGETGARAGCGRSGVAAQLSISRGAAAPSPAYIARHRSSGARLRSRARRRYPPAASHATRADNHTWASLWANALTDRPTQSHVLARLGHWPDGPSHSVKPAARRHRALRHIRRSRGKSLDRFGNESRSFTSVLSRSSGQRFSRMSRFGFQPNVLAAGRPFKLRLAVPRPPSRRCSRSASAELRQTAQDLCSDDDPLWFLSRHVRQTDTLGLRERGSVSRS